MTLHACKWMCTVLQRTSRLDQPCGEMCVLRAGLLAVFVAITLALTGTNNPGLSG